MSRFTSRPIILDGGMSRELIKLNAPFRQPEWSALALLEAPHLVQQAHRRFIDAGADVITTNSYALVPFHIGEERFRQRGEELIRLSGQVARDAADEEFAKTGRKVLVAGCLPPIFGSYEPDKFDNATVQDYLSVLVRGLEPYVDLWLGETLSLIAEAEAVRTALKGSNKPVWISYTLDDDDDDERKNEETNTSKVPSRLRSGESVTEAAQWAVDSGAEGLLFNCSRPESMAAAVVDAKSVFDRQQKSSIKIGVYANAFQPRPKEQAANEGISALRDELNTNRYTEFAREWRMKGADILGGCCGICSEHIASLAQAFRED